MSEKFRLEPSREFLRECVPQIAFFRTFFSKKKVHKGAGFAGNFRIDDTCSACFANSFRYFLAKMPASSSRRSLQGCSAPLAYPLFSAKPARMLRTACISPLLGEACKGAPHRLHIPPSGRQKILVRPPFPQAQKSRTNRNNPARSAPFFLPKRPPPGGFFNFRKNFLKICYLSHPFCGYYRCKALLRSGKEETLWRTKK